MWTGGYNKASTAEIKFLFGVGKGGYGPFTGFHTMQRIPFAGAMTTTHMVSRVEFGGVEVGVGVVFLVGFGFQL